MPTDAWYVEESLTLLALCGPQTRLVNSYGVTEVTIDSTYFELGAGRDGAMTSSAMVPIGRPFPNQEIYVLDGGLTLGTGARRVLLQGRNLLDRRAYPSGDVSSHGVPRYYILAPRSVDASVVVRW